MCGIAGEVNYSRAPDPYTIQAMTATLAPRGPDGEGLWLSERAALGHRRLTILDPEGGHQPMLRETSLGSVALTYAGEIYNHEELRKELRSRGHDFRTRSDTEVILNGYLEFGEGIAERLRGMFAAAIWDGRQNKQQLTMMRDHFGVKPLCYYPTPDGVLFGSDSKTILAHPDVEPAVGLSGLQRHFGCDQRPGPRLWEGMKEVKPGEVVTVDPSGICERRYWRLQSRPHMDDYGTPVERTRDLLKNSTREQLLADVPVGTMLSGGLDSTILAAIAAAFSDALDSYTVDFTGHSEYFRGDLYNAAVDTLFAEEAAAALHTRHNLFVLDSLKLAAQELRERVVRAFDLPLPLVRDAYASLLLFFEQIRGQSRAVLSGDMADDLFGGYVIFFEPRVRQGDGWSWYLRDTHQYNTQFDALNPDFREALNIDTYLADTYAEAAGEVERLEGESDLSYRLRVINYLEITRHIGYLLDYTDRLSGSVGLEVRVPFCDPRLVEYIYNVPWEFKAPDGVPKGLLKDAFKDLIPASILQRQKSPYPRTPHPGYSQELQRQVRELLVQPSRPVFDIMSRARLDQIVNKQGPLTYAEDGALGQALEMDTWYDI